MTARIATASTLALVVPTYNERDRLPELVHAIFAAYDSAGIHGEVVIVDDNSPDGTGQVADALARNLPIRVIHRAGKLGLGTAVVEGFAAAAAGSLARSMPISAIRPISSAYSRGHTGGDRADFVIGLRYVPGGGTATGSKRAC